MITEKLCVAMIMYVALAATASGEPQMSVDPQTGEVGLVHEAPPLHSQGEVPPNAAAPVPLSAERDDAFRADLNVHALEPVTEAEKAAADASFAAEFGHVTPGPARAGMVRLMMPPLVLADDTAQRLVTGDGQTLWTMAIRSPGAFGMRIHFTQFDVRSGSAVLYAYAGQERVMRGPYTAAGPRGTGEFWSPSLPGDVVYIDVVGAEHPIVEVADIVHFDFDPAHPLGGSPEGGPLSCHLDVMCHSPGEVSEVARDATGILTDISSGENVPFCTGTLLNDLDGETVVPYFLTAYHCLSTQAEANTLEVVWLWQRDSCGGPLPDFSTLPRNTGATLLETNPTSGGNDMAFLRLDGSVPGGVSLAGWTTAHPNSAYGIHHPAGSWKRTNFKEAEGICPGCEFCGDGTDYDYYEINPDNGVIEPGSSGSGIFGSSGQLFGQLFGTCCVIVDCAGDVFNCAEADEFDAQYGEFETTHPIIRDWLEIGGTINVNHANLTPPWNGTPTDPFRTVAQAHAFAWNGAQIKIVAGSYPENLTLSKQVTLRAVNGVVSIGQ